VHAEGIQAANNGGQVTLGMTGVKILDFDLCIKQEKGGLHNEEENNFLA
jgi:hypothetical protein